MKLKCNIHPIGIALLVASLVFLPLQLLLAGVAALVLHEAGHAAVMKLCGVKNVFIELTPFGGVADAEGFHSLHWFKQFLCAFSGVGISALAAGFSLLFRNDGMFWRCFFSCNSAMLFLNLLPALPLDGARCIIALTVPFQREKNARRLTLFFSYFLAMMLLVLGVFGAINGVVNPSLFLLPPYLCYAAKRSVLLEEIRQLERSFHGTIARKGEIRKAKMLVTAGLPDQMSVLRIVKNSGDGEYPLLLVLNPETEEMEEFLSMKQLRNILLNHPGDELLDNIGNPFE